MKHVTTTLLATLLALPAHAAITVRDDDGNAVTVARPAQRILALAPHITELLFAAGGGDRIAGVVSYSDYPEAAKKIAQVGDNRQYDMERIIAMKPDLIVIWMHGSAERQIAMLRQLKVPIYHSDPKKLADIPNNMERLGQLMGTEKVAAPAAAQLRAKLASLTARYAQRPPVRLFYQVWDKPLYTISGASIISDAMRVCGGQNVFAAMKIVAPVVTPEGVLQENPEAIFATSEKSDADSEGGLAMWRAFPSLAAVRGNNLFRLNGDLLNRAGPRMVDGAAALCEKLELARQHRAAPAVKAAK
ncbi:cobalamin-binding protein [Janthinobacterium psychrotolerans]|uniref:Iron complex transport system substrate-binding protein n=1 Tax=Janthinobacterium psychrotolerans TaxID=1747903 RepID=A0A1A7BZS3_9BURK|nr:cobalamin-binding protein [Janthinobacterium psychrotolerans]OBV39176.1 iron complex transport system substrate-binding protein [Janthinobacterium psychrotolerans]